MAKYNKIYHKLGIGLVRLFEFCFQQFHLSLLLGSRSACIIELDFETAQLRLQFGPLVTDILNLDLKIVFA